MTKTDANPTSPKDVFRLRCRQFKDLDGNGRRIDPAVNEQFEPVVYLDDAVLTPLQCRDVALHLVEAAASAERIADGFPRGSEDKHVPDLDADPAPTTD